MATLGNAIEKTLNRWIYPGDSNRPAFETLNALLSDSATSIAVTGRLGSDAVPDDCVVEIESELILMSSVSGTTLTFNERGYLETTAAQHASGTKVWIDPPYSRKALFDAANEIIANLYSMSGGRLYARTIDTTTTFSYTAPQSLPTGGLDILNIRVLPSATGTITRWNTLDEGTDYEVYYDTTPASYHTFGGSTSGSSQKVTYKKDFTQATTEADDLTTTCLVPAGLANQLPKAIAGTLLQGKELPAVQIEDIKRRLASEGVQVGSHISIGDALLQSFQRDVERECNRLRTLDKPKRKYARG